MSPSPLNPSQHVERIREILIGRDLHNMHGRLSRIESFMEEEDPEAGPTNLLQTVSKLREEQAALRQEIQSLKDQAQEPPTNNTLNDYTLETDEGSTSAVASRIDAHYRHILSHLQNELLKMKGEVHEELNALQSTKADRTEVTKRFARLASAAMEEKEHQKTAANLEKRDGYLLTSKNH